MRNKAHGVSGNIKDDYKIVPAFNIDYEKKDVLLRQDIKNTGLTSRREVQNQFRRNKIFHRFDIDSLHTESINAWSRRDWPIPFNKETWNPNKFAGILDNGWKIRKKTLYLIQATIPFHIVDDIYNIQVRLERNPLSWSNEELAFYQKESVNSTQDLWEYVEKDTINLHWIWVLEKWDEVILKNKIYAISSSWGQIRFWHEIGTLSLVSLSY